MGTDQRTQVRINPWREQAHDVTCSPKKNRSRSKGTLGEMAEGAEDGVKGQHPVAEIHAVKAEDLDLRIQK